MRKKFTKKTIGITMTQPPCPKPLNLSGLYGQLDYLSSSSSDTDASSGSDSPASPQVTTPASYVQRLLSENDLACNLTRQEGESLVKHLAAFSSYPDSPTSQLMANKLKDTSAALAAKLSVRTVNSPDFHKDAYPQLDEKGGWAVKIARQLRATACAHPVSDQCIPHVVNLQHIVKGEAAANHKWRGFHFCPPMHPLRQLLSGVRVNPHTGVFAGYYRRTQNDPDKFSTFFPDAVQNEKELLTLIQGAVKVCSDGNFVLCAADLGGNKFFIEYILHQGGELIHSAYPVFYVGLHEAGYQHQLTETLALSSEEIVDAIMNDDNSPDLIKYLYNDDQGKDFFIFDVASLFAGRTGIMQGIYIAIPTEELLGPDEGSNS